MKRFCILLLFSLILQIQIYAQQTYEYTESYLAMSADGRFLAITGRFIEDSSSKTSRRYLIDVYDAATGELVLEYGESEYWVSSLALNPDGEELSFANIGGLLAVVSVPNPETIQIIGGGYRDAGSPYWSPDGQFFAYIDGSGVGVLDTSNFYLYSLIIEQDRVSRVKGFAWHPTMPRIATIMYQSSSETRSILIWSIVPEFYAPLERMLEAEAGWQLSWHPTEELIATNLVGGISIIDLANDTETFLAGANPDEQFYSVAWSPDGAQIAGGGDAIYIWDVTTGEIIRTIETETFVSEVFWSPNGQHIYHTGGIAGIYRDGLPLWEAIANEVEVGG